MTTYLTPAAVAAKWSCSAGHVRRLCASGELVALKIGERGWRITPVALAAYEATHTSESTPEPATPQPAPQTTFTEIYGSVTPIFKGPVPWRTEVVQ